MNTKTTDPKGLLNYQAGLKIATAISEYMNAKGLDAKEMAALTKMPESRLLKILRGEKHLTVRVLNQVAHKLGCEIDISFKERRDKS